MVGAINAPKTGNTLDAFILLASNATASTFPEGGVAGGELVSKGSASSTTAVLPSGTGNAGASDVPVATGVPAPTVISPPINPANGATTLGSNSMAAAVVVVLGVMALL